MGKNLTIETIFLFFYQSYEKILNDDTVSLLFFLKLDISKKINNFATRKSVFIVRKSIIYEI